MKRKTIILLAVVVVLVMGTTFFLRADRNRSPDSGGSNGLIVSSNAIYVDDPLPGRSISIAMVLLEQPGYVVIHEDNKGQPGKIIGTSNVLSKGKTNSVTPIALSRITEDGETLYAMLHIDDGDSKFSSVKDKPALDSISGQRVMMIFNVTLNADNAGVINP